MSDRANNNRAPVGSAVSIAPYTNGHLTASSAAEIVRHVYVHIPFCARICPYCAFYKDLLDRSQTSRFCEALVQELIGHDCPARLIPSTIYFGGGTPTALNIAQLEFLLRGFHETVELSQLLDWSIEANPGSVSARKAALLKRLGVNRISL